MQTLRVVSKFLRHNKKSFLQVKAVSQYHRTYLSKAYHCEEEWNKRLETPLLKQINSTTMFFDIEKMFQISGRINAIDIDIFANIIQESINAEEIITMLAKLRTTTEASNMLPSTHHAVIRFLLKFNLIEDLFEILNDRLKYGIFPDHLCYNLMMNLFIKKKDFASAAKIASLLMLQEDYDNPISSAMALYSCHKYLEKPDDWKTPVIVNDEPVEEVKVRVRYLREPYFDEHFDLTEPSDLAGKTLSTFGKYLGTVEGRSCQLRGLILFKKYTDANKLIDGWIKEGVTDAVYKQVIGLIQKENAKIFEEDTNEEIQQLKELLHKLEDATLKEGCLTEALELDVKKAIEKQEKTDIEQQCKDYAQWINGREKVLKEHMAELNKQEKKKKFAQIKKELAVKERILTFFDKEEEIELEIEKKDQIYQQKYGHIQIKDTSFEEEYIPPEVKKRREPGI